MNEDPHIHDKFIQAIMSDRKIAGDYFKNFLPEFVSRYLDFSTLTQLPNSYLSDELKKAMSDIVYTCNKKEGNDSIKVSLLIEHKSYSDKKHPHPGWRLYIFGPAKAGSKQGTAFNCNSYTPLSW